MSMAAPRRLRLEAAHQLVPLPDGSWRMTGSDPQFLVRGPFASGVWTRTRNVTTTSLSAPPAPVRVPIATLRGLPGVSVSVGSSEDRLPGTRTVFAGMARSFDPDRAQGFQGSIQYELAGSRGVQRWAIQVAGRTAYPVKGLPSCVAASWASGRLAMAQPTPASGMAAPTASRTTSSLMCASANSSQ